MVLVVIPKDPILANEHFHSLIDRVVRISLKAWSSGHFSAKKKANPIVRLLNF
jgi:hypothetical protein